MEHNPKATANALAIVGGAWYILCVLWVLVSRNSYMGIMGSWFHGVDFNALPGIDLTFASVTVGLVTFIGFAWISGFFFAKAYNMFVKA